MVRDRRDSWPTAHDEGVPGAGESVCHSTSCAHGEALDRLRRDLHDQVGSGLAGVAVQLELAQKLMTGECESAAGLLELISAEIGDLVDRVRGMVSARCDSRPVGQDLAREFAALVERLNTGVDGSPRFDLELGRDLDVVADEVGASAFWIAQEATANVLRHSDATDCRVGVAVRNGELLLRVEDNGHGRLRSGRASIGFGLRSMRERARERGGSFTASSGARGGFVVSVAMPAYRERPDLKGAS